MAGSLTLITLLVCAVAFLALWLRRVIPREPLRVTVHLDRTAPGAHLIWEIANTGSQPMSLSELVVHSPHGVNVAMPLDLPHVLASSEGLTLPTDVDWTLLSARSIAVVDADGNEHAVSGRQLAAIQDQLRRTIDRRAPTMSARDFLFGAADFAFGAVILGLAFFMLMWIIATA